MLVLYVTFAGCGGGGSGGAPAALMTTPPAPLTAMPIEVTTSTPSPTITAQPAVTVPPTRGVKVVDSSEPQGVLRQIANGPAVGGPSRMPAQYRVTTPDEVRVETFVSGLEVPWSLAFAPDGRLFISERPGRIRTVEGGQLDSLPWATVPAYSSSESGLMGLALDPDFSNNPWVYICYTVAPGGTENRISRLRESNGRGSEEQILLGGLPAAAIHDGCRLKFGPDRKLYATMGDATQSSRAQDLNSLNGKILRLNPDGTVPADNPFGTFVYAYGNRNPQGLAFDLQTGALFETEHGPSGEFGLGNYDEVNIIVAGGNYGWPLAVGAPGLPQYHDPLLVYIDHAVPPAGATFYTGARIPQWTGNFFFTSLRGQHLQRIVLDNQNQVVAIERLFETDFYAGVYGRLRDVVEGPDGALYVATSNRDGRGTPAQDDDRVLRLVGSQS